MRVIAGTARRINLVAPLGSTTRPTSDRAKEALFSILAADLADAFFLDLFCGSGAMGIEALSRGAAFSVFVDTTKAAIQAVTHNLQATKLQSKATLMQCSAKDAIQTFDAKGSNFDLIFMDPPYDGNWISDTLALLANTTILNEGGQIIVETETKLPLPEASGFTLTHQRDYGRTRFLFYA
ncbi:MAG: 16S rRNA (guanine(966)-N(2))-methyltransferase RsmD [Defluviitaleaceae bacterium]|nr:16S rRNA (guanine(966)-N(2))-methyltransferase RsmD [Defluviitaleaceae bacterium]